MCKQQQLKKAKAARCHHCMGLGDFGYKTCVSFRVVKPYVNAEAIAQYFCHQHCALNLLSQHMETQKEYRLWIEQAIARLDEAGGVYHAQDVYLTAGLQRIQLTRYPELYEEVKLLAANASQASKMRDYSRRVQDAIKELKGTPGLTVKRILDRAGIRPDICNAHEFLWKPVYKAIARSGGRVPARGEQYTGGKRRAA